MAKEQKKKQEPSGFRARLPSFLTEPILSSEAETEKELPSAETPEPQESEAAEVGSGQEFQTLFGGIREIQEEMQLLSELVEEVNRRESAQEKVFNTLHAELRDYKNDFIYERLKPIVRPLLFLYDSLEQFDSEIDLYEEPVNAGQPGATLTADLVRENITYFRDQLVEALRICEVTPMDMPKGEFNPRIHKAIDVVPVDAAQDGQIQRVVRSGWYLNGQLLRSAEVIVGKNMSKKAATGS